MNLTEVIADRGGKDFTQMNGYVKVDISGIDGNVLLGSLAGVQYCRDISGGMSPREISMLPRETAKVERQRSQVQFHQLSYDGESLEFNEGNKDIDTREEKETTVCSKVTTGESVYTDSTCIPLTIKPGLQVPRLQVKRKCFGKSSFTKVWYPCFSGANSPFKHSHCSMTRKKGNPSIDVCYKS